MLLWSVPIFNNLYDKRVLLGTMMVVVSTMLLLFHQSSNTLPRGMRFEFFWAV